MSVFLEYILPSLQKAPAVLVPEFRTEERRLNIFKKTRMHPVHTEILLGYTSGDLFYWSLKDIKVVMPTHPFSLNPPPPSLKCPLCHKLKSEPNTRLIEGIFNQIPEYSSIQ